MGGKWTMHQTFNLNHEIASIIHLMMIEAVLGHHMWPLLHPLACWISTCTIKLNNFP